MKQAYGTPTRGGVKMTLNRRRFLGGVAMTIVAA
jgi:hypothetical protein